MMSSLKFTTILNNNFSLKGNLGAPIYLFSFLLQVGALSAFLPFNVKLICLKEKHDHLKMDIATWCYKWMADGLLSPSAKSTYGANNTVAPWCYKWNGWMGLGWTTGCG